MQKLFDQSKSGASQHFAYTNFTGASGSLGSSEVYKIYGCNQHHERTNSNRGVNKLQWHYITLRCISVRFVCV